MSYAARITPRDASPAAPGRSRGTLIALLGILLSSGITAPAQAQQREFRIVNGTQAAITELRYRLPQAIPFPTENALTGNPIAPGAQRAFALDRNMACVWDIRVTFASGSPSVLLEQNLCTRPEVRVADIGTTDVLIRNATNEDIRTLATRVPGQGGFGNNLFENPVRPGQFGIIAVASGRLGCVRDLRAGFASNAMQISRRADLCAAREFSFDTPGRGTYIIENTSQQPLTGLFTRLPGGQWSEIRGFEAVPAGRWSSLTGDVSQTCMRELRAVFANRQEQVSAPIDVCAADRVTIAPQAIAAVMPEGTAAPPPVAAGPGPGPAPGPGPGQQQASQAGPQTAPPPGPRAITVANTWHIQLRQFHLRQPGTQDPGPDLLGQGVLNPQREVNLQLPGQGCRFDVLGLYGDEYGITVEVGIANADLCANRRVVMNGPPPGRQLGGGTGFYATRQGLIVTNRHVTRMCNSVRLQAGGAVVPLELVVDDPVNDLAVLRGPSRATPAVVFRVEAQPARLGESVMAIGYPIGQAVGNQVFPVSGQISAVAGRQGRDNEFSMTAPINPGHSGGPIFDESGLLVGIAVAGLTRSGERAIQNVNFGIRATVLRRLLRSINAEVEEAPPGTAMRAPDLIDRSLPLVLSLSCFS